MVTWNTRAVRKDPGPAVDNDPPGSPAIIGPGFSWHKLPQQKQLTTKKKPPRLVTGPLPPNATYPRAVTVGKSNDNHDPKTGEFTDGGDKGGDLYKERNDDRVNAANAMKELRQKLNPLKKDSADTESTNSDDNNGRPRWMASPGVGGKDPVYRSQKPGPNGNSDSLFSSNVNKNPPKVVPLSEDGFYIW